MSSERFGQEAQAQQGQRSAGNEFVSSADTLTTLVDLSITNNQEHRVLPASLRDICFNSGIGYPPIQ